MAGREHVARRHCVADFVDFRPRACSLKVLREGELRDAAADHNRVDGQLALDALALHLHALAGQQFGRGLRVNHDPVILREQSGEEERRDRRLIISHGRKRGDDMHLDPLPGQIPSGVAVCEVAAQHGDFSGPFAGRPVHGGKNIEHRHAAIVFVGPDNAATRARGDDHHVRIHGFDIVDADRGTHDDGHVQFTQLTAQPIGEVAMVGLDPAAVAELTAERLRSLVDRHSLTLLFQHAGRMHARNPASDHQDANRRGGGLDGPGGLECGLRVGRASGRRAGHGHLEAGVAADTGQNVLRSRLNQLAHVMRIGVESAGQRNVVDAFLLHDRAGEFRVIEPLRDTHRDAVADDLSDCGRIGHEPSLGCLGSLKHLERRLIGGSGDVDQVDAGVGQHLAERRALLDLQSAWHELDGRNSVPDRVVLADHRTKGGQDIEREPCTILQRAAVLVSPSVGVRGQKLADQVAVRAVDVNHVDPGLETAPRRLHKSVDDDLDVLTGHRTRHGARIDKRARHGGGRDRLALTGRARSLASAVVELHRELGSVLVDGVGDFAEPRNDGVVVAAHLVRVATPFRSHIDRLELNQRHAAFRPLAAVMDVPLV